MRCRGFVALTLVLLVSSCSSQAVETPTPIESERVLTAEQVDAIYANAVNQNGWIDVDPPTWAALASEACDLGAWDPEVNAGLTERFLTDLGMVDRPNADQVPGIIWMNLHVACHDLVPVSASPLPGWLGGATAPAETTPVTGAFVSPSLEKVGDLRPNEWPWFSDRVPVPLDAVAGGSDFLEILNGVPALANFTILSAERYTYDGSDIPESSALFKVSDHELLEIRTSLFKPEATAVWYPPPGIRESDWKPQLIYVNLIIGNRFVGMHARVTNFDEDLLSLTTDDLFAIAEEIIVLYEIQP